MSGQTNLVGHSAYKCFEPESFEAVWVLSMAQHPTFSIHMYATGSTLLAFEVLTSIPERDGAERKSEREKVEGRVLGGETCQWVRLLGLSRTFRSRNMSVFSLACFGEHHLPSLCDLQLVGEMCYPHECLGE